MSPGGCSERQPQVSPPVPYWAATAGWEHPCSRGAGGGTAGCHFCPQAVHQCCARGLRAVPCPPTPAPTQGRAVPSTCHPRHPPCVAPSLPPGAGGPMGARHVGQRVRLGVLCWGCLTASLAQKPATERGASVSGNVPAQTKQGWFGKSRVVWGSGWDRRRRPFPARAAANGGAAKGGAAKGERVGGCKEGDKGVMGCKKGGR